MIESLVKNLNQDIALLQLKIEQNKASGFYDMARLLEAISIQFFKALSIADLKSKNQIHVNFPAIDSADDNKRIALQVTSVAMGWTPPHLSASMRLNWSFDTTS